MPRLCFPLREPSRFFSIFGVKTEFRGSLLDTMIDPMWVHCGINKQLKNHLERGQVKQEDTHTHTHTTYSRSDSPIHKPTFPCVTHTTNTFELLLHVHHLIHMRKQHQRIAWEREETPQDMLQHAISKSDLSHSSLKLMEGQNLFF
jgi:hypothetical protein